MSYDNEFGVGIVAFTKEELEESRNDVSGDLVNGLEELGYNVSYENNTIIVSSNSNDVVTDVKAETKQVPLASNDNNDNSLLQVMKNNTKNQNEHIKQQNVILENKNKLLEEQNKLTAKTINAIEKQSLLVANMVAVLSKGVSLKNQNNAILKNSTNASVANVKALNGQETHITNNIPVPKVEVTNEVATPTIQIDAPQVTMDTTTLDTAIIEMVNTNNDIKNINVNLVDAIKSHKESVDNIKDVNENISNAIVSSNEVSQNMKNTNDTLVEAVQSHKESVDNIKDVNSTISSAIVSSNEVSQNIKNTNDTLVEAVQSHKESVDNIKDVNEGIKTAMEKIGEGAESQKEHFDFLKNGDKYLKGSDDKQISPRLAKALKDHELGISQKEINITDISEVEEFVGDLEGFLNGGINLDINFFDSVFEILSSDWTMEINNLKGER